MLQNFIKDDGEYLVFTGNYMEAYIPEFYFERKLAEEMGTFVKCFGLFNVRMFDEKNNPLKLQTLNIPTLINLFPNEIEKKELQLLDDVEPERYRVIKFFKGSKITNINVPQNASNVELFLEVLIRGKVPKTIPYSQVLEIWQKNLQLNGVKLGVTSTVLEVIIAEIYRNSKKPEERFAKVIGKDSKVSEYDYRSVNIREICARNSTFSALTFEDMDQMIISSLNMNRYNKKQTESPIEKIIKM